MKRNASSQDGSSSKGPSKLFKQEPSRRYTSKVQSTAHGFDYQQDVALLLLLRAKLRDIRFSLAYEMTDAGHFDDVVFINESENECLLIQVKHGSTRGTIQSVTFSMLFPKYGTETCDKGDFSLPKYLKSYTCNLQDLPRKKHFILFTNKQLTRSLKAQDKFAIVVENLEPKPILYFNDSTEKPIRLKLTDKAANEMVNYISEQLATKLSLDDVSDFFGNLQLLFKQPELRQIIRSELLVWIRTWMHPVHLAKIDEEDNFNDCLRQLEKCLYHGSEYDKETNTKSFLTLEQGKHCLSELREHLSRKNGLFNYSNTLATVEDYYIHRQVRLTDRNIAVDHDFCKLLTDTYADDTIIVLTAKPGMGKSALFHHVSMQIQRSTEDMVFLIYLNNLIGNLKQVREVDSIKTTLKILQSVVFETNLNIILEASESENPKGQRIYMFFDGFDEIAPMYEEKVIQMIQTLEPIKCIRIIVSGRRHVEKLLTENFEKTRFLNLVPYTEQDQTEFLRAKWKISTEDYSKFDAYSAHILEEFDKSVADRWCEFFGIPLMLKMFADIKEDDFKRFVRSEEVLDIDTIQPLTVVQLYEQFIENSLDIKFDKLHLSGCRENESEEDFYLKHQLLAVNQLSCLDLLPSLDSASMETKFDQFVQKIRKGEERSPLVECVNGKVQFIHRSYAEYMVAKYLYENIEESKIWFEPEKEFEDIEEIDSEYDVIRKFLLNMIEEHGESVHFRTIAEMCKISCNWTVHAVIAEGCLKTIENLIANNSSFVHSFYLSKHSFNNTSYYRQPIHFAAKYGHEQILHMLIEKGANINAQCSAKSTPLHYAVENERIVRILLNYSANVNVQKSGGQTPLCEAVFFNRNEVAKMLIEHEVDESLKIAVNHAAKIGKTSIVKQIFNNTIRNTYRDGLASKPLHRSYVDACKLELKKVLLNSSVDVSFEDFDGKTPLHYAAKTCQPEIVRLLLEKTENASFQDFKGKTPLHYAAEEGHHQIFELLLEKTDDVNLSDNKGRKPLHYASKAGHVTIVELLLKNSAEFDSIDSQGNLPLDYASDAGNHQIVELLLKKCFEKGSQNFERKSPLNYAARAGLFQIVEMLLTKSVDVNSQDFTLNSPLHYAAFLGHHKIVELLLDKSANVNSQGKQRITPLHLASWKGHDKIVELLLQKSAFVDVRTFMGITPLHCAVVAGHQKIVKMLIENLADVDAQDNEENTPLHYAAERGHQHIIETLLDYGADVNLRNHFQETPLLKAAKAGKTEAVELLFGKSEDLYLRDTEGGTLLHYTAKAGLVAIVNLLLEKVEDVDSEDNLGKTPLHYAAQAGHEQIVRILLEKTKKAEVRDNEGKNVLHYAAEAGLYNIVAMMLKSGNVPDNQGRLPLHYAVIAGKQQIVELLLENTTDVAEKSGSRNSKDVNLPDNYGRTPLHYAAEGSNQIIIEALLEKSADANVEDISKQTPLLKAAQAGISQNVTLLFDKSADVKSKDIQGKTLLHYSAKEGFIEIVSRLLADGLDVNSQDKMGKSPLHLAVKAKHVEIVDLMLKKGGDVDLQDTFGKSPLHYAAQSGHEEIFSMLLNKSRNENTPDVEGKTTLHYAAEAGNFEIVALMKKSETVLQHDNNGRIPLHYAAKAGQQKIVELLLGESRNVDLDNWCKQSNPTNPSLNRVVEALFGSSMNFYLKDNQGQTIIHCTGNQQIVESLLNKNMDVNAQDCKGKTPLHYATQRRKSQIVEYLLEKGANVNSQDSKGRTPLHCVAKLAIKNTAMFFLKNYFPGAGQNLQKIVELLMTRAVDVNIQDKEGMTPLHYAAHERGRYDYLSNLVEETLSLYYASCQKIVELSLDKSVDISLRDNSGRTPLHYAAQTDKIEIVQLLLRIPFDVNALDAEGKTYLHYAARKGCLPIVELLLNKSADMNIQDKFNKLPVHYAAQAGHDDVVAMIERV